VVAAFGSKSRINVVSADRNWFTPQNRVWFSLNLLSQNSQGNRHLWKSPVPNFYPNPVKNVEYKDQNSLTPVGTVRLSLHRFSRNSCFLATFLQAAATPNSMKLWQMVHGRPELHLRRTVATVCVKNDHSKYRHNPLIILCARWRWKVNITPQVLYPEESETRYQFNMGLCGPQRQYGRFREEISCAYLDSNPGPSSP
jgi:hypothetical protein